MSQMKLIVGLGNPGPRYSQNRHNIGFQCINLYAKRHQITSSKMQSNAMTGAGWVQRQIVKDGERLTERCKILLVKPLTYMNTSGKAVGALARYYQVELSDIIVIHDDLDLESGKLRMRPKGGSGGQNGIKSIIHHLGDQTFPRIRVGIGRPPGRMDPAAYVLRDFNSQEEEIFGPLREKVLDAIDYWLFEGIERAMNKFNS